jgi:hypothetical protein
LSVRSNTSSVVENRERVSESRFSTAMRHVILQRRQNALTRLYSIRTFAAQF